MFRESSRVAGRLKPLLVFVAGLGVSGALAWRQSVANDRRVASELDAVTESAERQVSDRLAIYGYGLLGARASVLGAGRDGLTRQSFRAYHESRDLAVEFPGARSFGFIRRVPREHEAEFLARASHEWSHAAKIHQRHPHAGELRVVEYIEPSEQNLPSLGLDLASDPALAPAAERALRSGQATITPPIARGPTHGPYDPGFLMLLPVYQPGVPRNTDQEREAAGFGWTCVSLAIAEMLTDLDRHDDGLTVALADVTDSPPAPFFGPADADAATDPALTRRTVLPIYGRLWQLEVRAGAPFLDGLALVHPTTYLVVGGVLFALLALLLAAQLRGQSQQRRLLERQTQLNTLIANSSDAIIAEDLRGVIISWNRGAERLLGYRADEALGQPRSRFLGFDSERAEDATLEDARNGRTMQPADQTCRRRDGAQVPVAVLVAPITADNGRLVGLGRIMRDISSRKSAETHLREFNAALEVQVQERTAQLEAARRHLRTVLDSLPSIVGYWDRELINRFANRSYGAWFGVDPNTLPGRHMRELLGERLFELNRPHIDGALRGEPQNFVRALPRPDGSGEIHSLAHYVPDLVDGEVRGFYVLVHDISELIHSRQSLTAAVREKDALLQSIRSHVLYVVVDLAGCVVDVNQGMCDLSGFSREELIGQRHQVLNITRSDPRLPASMEASLLVGVAWRGELRGESRDGTPYWVDAVVAPFPGVDGSTARYVAIGTDVTARRSVADALRAAKRSAESANAAKSEFLANVSHEIRTPLNAIIGLSHLLDRTAMTGEQRGFLAKIQLAGRSLLSLVHDVLDLAKIEAGEMRLEVARFDLGEVLGDLLTLLEPQAQAKSLAVSVHFSEPLPTPLLGDATRIRQIVTNLVGNAIKFTERGSVRLVVSIVQRDEHQVRVLCEVHDTGIGVPLEGQARLFAPFSQADTSTTRRFGGTGLGLSIVQHLAGLMGGEAGVDSRVGEGSNFWVVLSLALAPALPAPAPAPGPALAPPRDPLAPRLAGVRVLVADDSAINREVATMFLRHEGATVVACGDGQEAVDLLRADPGGFDVVLMDVQMPLMSGDEATLRIRGELGLAELPVIAVTASALLAERQRALAAGMNEFIVKPLDPEQLVRAILGHVTRAAAA